MRDNMLEKYGIIFNNNSLINVALTHTSYANEHNLTSYERLEYLGDAVLDLVVSEYLYKNTKLSEGEMSKVRSSYVCENALYEYSKIINLKKYIRVGNGISSPNKTVIADVFEAVIGVIFLEFGLSKVKEFFESLILPLIKHHDVFLYDYKSLLQELVQTNKKSVEYFVVDESGPAHDKTFVVEVIIDDIVFGRGKGKSKKEAEQNAAKDAYSKQAK